MNNKYIYPKITQPFTEIFKGDASMNVTPRQTPDVLYTFTTPQVFPDASVVHYNQSLGDFLGFKSEPTSWLTAQEFSDKALSYATAYAGHQFGNWAGQLGDGRAICLGELIAKNNQTVELQWKGAGQTPYSRTADGKAVLRSSVREYLMSEAMHYLGVPTTRALSFSVTGEQIPRDLFYNGNVKNEQGALVLRTASSFLRFGHFDLLSARQDTETSIKLADYIIDKYYPEITEKSTKKYTQLFEEITDRTIDLMVDWYRVGFVHGVMNTDNMSVVGLTIDYGPFSMLDAYDASFTPNTTDLPNRRYAFGKQSGIAQWNLYQLANAMLPINGDVEGFQKIINRYANEFQKKYQQMIIGKLGLDFFQFSDVGLIKVLLKLLQEVRLDYTLFFNCLICFSESFCLSDFDSALYEKLSQDQVRILNEFIILYSKRIKVSTLSNKQRIAKMQENNPKFILRNYLLHECIQEVEKGDLTLFNKLWKALQNPYQSTFKELECKAPNWAFETDGCSQLSCSS